MKFADPVQGFVTDSTHLTFGVEQDQGRKTQNSELLHEFRIALFRFGVRARTNTHQVQYLRRQPRTGEQLSSHHCLALNSQGQHITLPLRSKLMMRSFIFTEAPVELLAKTLVYSQVSPIEVAVIFCGFP